MEERHAQDAKEFVTTAWGWCKVPLGQLQNYELLVDNCTGVQ